MTEPRPKTLGGLVPEFELWTNNYSETSLEAKALGWGSPFTDLWNGQ